MDWFGDYDDFGIYLGGLGDYDETETGGIEASDIEDDSAIIDEPSIGELADAALAPVDSNQLNASDDDAGRDDDGNEASTGGGRSSKDKSPQELEREREARRAFADVRASTERLGKQAVVQLLTPRTQLTSATWHEFSQWVRTAHVGWSVRRREASEGDKREHGQVGAGKCFWVDALYAGDANRAKSGTNINNSGNSSGSSRSHNSSSHNGSSTNSSSRSSSNTQASSSGSSSSSGGAGNGPRIRIVHGGVRSNTTISASSVSSFGAGDLRTPVKRHRSDSHENPGGILVEETFVTAAAAAAAACEDTRLRSHTFDAMVVSNSNSSGTSTNHNGGGGIADDIDLSSSSSRSRSGTFDVAAFVDAVANQSHDDDDYNEDNSRDSLGLRVESSDSISFSGAAMMSTSFSSFDSTTNTPVDSHPSSSAATSLKGGGTDGSAYNSQQKHQRGSSTNGHHQLPGHTPSSSSGSSSSGGSSGTSSSSNSDRNSHLAATPLASRAAAVAKALASVLSSKVVAARGAGVLTSSEDEARRRRLAAASSMANAASSTPNAFDETARKLSTGSQDGLSASGNRRNSSGNSNNNGHSSYSNNHNRSSLEGNYHNGRGNGSHNGTNGSALKKMRPSSPLPGHSSTPSSSSSSSSGHTTATNNTGGAAGTGAAPGGSAVSTPSSAAQAGNGHGSASAGAATVSSAPSSASASVGTHLRCSVARADVTTPLGINIYAPTDATSELHRRVAVASVAANTPAYRAGLRAGDVLITMNGQRVRTTPVEGGPADLGSAVAVFKSLPASFEVIILR